MTSEAAELAEAEQLLGRLRLPRRYCTLEPTTKQDWFLRRDELEVFFGGAAGPGKSWGLLMAALQYVDVPGYHALLLRPSLKEFMQPGGLIEVSHRWLGGTDAFWHGGKQEWTFPSGATIRFSYLSNLGDMRQFKGPSYSFCGFDELTGFPEMLYRSMFRVLRQAKGGDLEGVPLRMRSASNPGGPGHDWVKSRFIDPASRVDGAIFVPAWITDNPHMDYEEYLKSLAHLSPVERERLIKGDWDVMEEGGKFHREDFLIIDAHEAPPPVKSVRYWDLAATEPSESNPDPDYTVGLRMEVSDGGIFTVRHMVCFRLADDKVERRVRSTAEEDGRSVPVYVEQEPGASGKLVLSHFKRKVLQGFACYAGSTRGGDKEVRARPVAAAVGNHLVQVVRGPHLLEFLDQCSIFPNGAHDDFVDALSGSHTALTRSSTGQLSVSRARGRIPGVERHQTSSAY